MNLDELTDKLNGKQVEVDKTGNTMSISVKRKTSQITTLAQLLDVSKVDTKKWQVQRHVANIWNCYSAVNGMQDLWQIKAWFERVLAPNEWLEVLNKAASETLLAKDLTLKIAPKTKSGLIIYSVPDLHLGKLCWGKQTGGADYDVNIAAKEFKNAIIGLSSRTEPTDECWIPIGNDFFNVDNEQATTTHGTPQDEDGRPQKTFEIGVKLIAWAVEYLKKKHKKVVVITVPGNHDEERSFFLGQTIKIWFRGDKRVEVNNNPALRKYKVFGDTLFGMMHGDRIKKSNLLTIMQTEARHLWGKTLYAEWLLGHFHHDHVIDDGGVIIRYLQSLTPPDRYHSKAGFTMAKRAAQALFYSLKGFQTLHEYTIRK